MKPSLICENEHNEIIIEKKINTQNTPRGSVYFNVGADSNIVTSQGPNPCNTNINYFTWNKNANVNEQLRGGLTGIFGKGA